MRTLGICMCVAIGAAVSVLATNARAEVVVTISKAQQQLAVTVDGAERYRWAVSTGRRGLETPSGDFRPIRLERKWYSRKYDWSPMPYSIFFHRGYAVHGTYEKRNLGRAASHGCVRLLPAHAAILFALVRREGRGNTRIAVTNGPLPAPPGVRPAVVAAVVAAPIVLPRAKPAPVVPVRAVEVVKAAAPKIAVPKIASAKIETPKIEKPAIVPRAAPRQAAPPRSVPSYRDDRFTATGDEAAVMRGREAWLRSLDRKYGITR